MRVKIHLDCSGKKKIDYNYQYYIASALYDKFHQANMDLATKVHYRKGFKFFNFSNLMFENYTCHNNEIEFNGKVWFILASPNKEIMEAMIEGVLKNAILDIKNTKFVISSIEVLRKPEITNNTVYMKTLSPIITTTITDKNGEKHTWDLAPSDLRFHSNIRQNIIKKYTVFYSQKPKNQMFDIIKILHTKPKRIRIKNTYHTCYHMHFILKASKELIYFALDTGLGEKNSMGFGCVDIIHKKQKVGGNN